MLSRWSAFQRDACVAVAMALLSAVLLTDPVRQAGSVRHAADVVGVLLVLGMTLPLAWRRVAPLACLAIAIPCAVVAIELDYAILLPAAFVMWGITSAALHTDRRTAVLLGVVTCVAVQWLARHGVTTMSSRLLLLGVGIVPALFGDALRSQRVLAAETRERALRLEQLRSLEIERAVAAERTRIARDVHDVVGHHLSSISLQAAAGGRVTATRPRDAAHSFELIGRAASMGLDETRRMLMLLREDDAAAETSAAPGLGDLPALVGQLGAAGIDVRLERIGPPRRLPDAIEVCAFRIVQEALTNVAKHAVPASADVLIEHRRDGLLLRIDDDGRAAPVRPAGAAHGQGLIGMRERALLAGGRLDAGPRAGGGWRVEAFLPSEPPG